jgi:branched-chain amino acid transport system permease protein
MNAGLSVLPARLAAVIVCALVGVLVGIPALRFRGDYFVVALLGFQMVAFVVLYNWVSLTKGPYGIPGIPRPMLLGVTVGSLWGYLLLVAVLAVVVCGGLLILYRSPFGIALRALRDNERAAEALGISAFRQFLWAMGTAAAAAAIPGACYASYVTYIDPTSFTLKESIFQASILLVGGAGNARGPASGTLFMVLLPEALRFVGLPDAVAANLREIIYGSMLVALMYWRPQGMCGVHGFR